MSADDKNRKLAELLGFSNVNYRCRQYPGYGPGSGIGTLHDERQSIPNYCASLDAVHSVVKSLTEPQRQLYRENLCRQLHITLALDADAETRVDALILTLEEK